MEASGLGILIEHFHGIQRKYLFERGPHNGNVRFSHQGWIRGKTLDHWVLGQFSDRGQIGTISEDLDPQLREIH